MPNNLVGLAIYIFALFPGIAFVFSREGHRPTVKRSVFRESATVVFVSAICDGIIFLLIIIGSLFIPPISTAINGMLTDWHKLAMENIQLFLLISLSLLAAATAFGWVLGTKRVHDLGGSRLWWSALVERDSSAWGAAFTTGPDGKELKDKVLLGIQLKTGSWFQGYLYRFDNSGDGEVSRALTLSGNIKHRAKGAEKLETLYGFGLLVVEAGDIDYLLIAYEEIAATDREVSDGRR